MGKSEKNCKFIRKKNSFHVCKVLNIYACVRDLVYVEKKAVWQKKE